MRNKKTLCPLFTEKQPRDMLKHFEPHLELTCCTDILFFTETVNLSIRGNKRLNQPIFSLLVFMPLSLWTLLFAY